MTRRDLSPGYQATQATHAALQWAVLSPEVTRDWYKTSNYLIVVTVADQQELLALADRAEDRGLRVTVFTEPDLPEGDQRTAIVMTPGPEAKRLCSNLPLCLREEALV